MEVAVAYVALGLVVQKIVEHVRTLFPIIDGVWVSALGVVLGLLAVWGTDVRLLADVLPGATIAAWFDFLVTGLALSAGAGFLADISGRSGEMMSR